MNSIQEGSKSLPGIGIFRAFLFHLQWHLGGGTRDLGCTDREGSTHLSRYRRTAASSSSSQALSRQSRQLSWLSIRIIHRLLADIKVRTCAPPSNRNWIHPRHGHRSPNLSRFLRDRADRFSVTFIHTHYNKYRCHHSTLGRIFFDRKRPRHPDIFRKDPFYVFLYQYLFCSLSVLICRKLPSLPPF